MDKKHRKIKAFTISTEDDIIEVIVLLEEVKCLT